MNIIMNIIMSNKSKYLTFYPVQWPEFSTKNYVKDQDGWWHWIKNRIYKKQFKPQKN